MQDWEKEFLGSVPDEDLLLKELHLIGIYPDILPGLIEGDVGEDQDIQEPNMGINSKFSSTQLAGEAPFKNSLVTQRSSRSKYTIHDFTGTANVPLESDLYVDESWNTAKGRRLCSSELGLPKGRVAANKKKKNRPAPQSAKRKRGTRGDDKSCHELTKSKKVTRSVPKDSLQKVEAASSGRLAERTIMGDSPIEGMDVISSRDALEDLNSLLDLDVDLLQEGGDNLSCLDIPMDDLSTLDFMF
uniref:Uncharacterized protein n=2 Tax=Kalanchoe fedtschenkoi TaxID=63787 RepID=A0A7N0V9S0_KALFE